MQINKPLNGVVPASGAKPDQGIASRLKGSTEQADGSVPYRSDQVEISDEARRLAAQQAAESGEKDSMSLSPARLKAIQDRISSGAYLSPRIAGEVARAIIDRSEL